MGPSFLVAVFVVDLLQESESENRERGAYDNASGISISISTEERVARLSVCLRGFGPEGVCQSTTNTHPSVVLSRWRVRFVSAVSSPSPFPCSSLSFSSFGRVCSVPFLFSPSQIVRAPLLHVGTAGEGRCRAAHVPYKPCRFIRAVLLLRWTARP